MRAAVARCDHSTNDRSDDHNLIRYYHIIPAMIFGGGTAAIAYVVNGYALYELTIDFRLYTRFGAPLIEELMKGALIVWFFWRQIKNADDLSIIGVCFCGELSLPTRHGRCRIAEPHDRPPPKPLMATRFQVASITCFSSSNGILDDTVLPVSTISLMNLSTGASSKR